jgi:hypothetical protein
MFSHDIRNHRLPSGNGNKTAEKVSIPEVSIKAIPLRATLYLLPIDSEHIRK